jgi:hypothetical protein
MTPRTYVQSLFYSSVQYTVGGYSASPNSISEQAKERRREKECKIPVSVYLLLIYT